MKLSLFEAPVERSILTVRGAQLDKFIGDFYCYGDQLTSLEGAPAHVGGGFNCNNNQLTSLKGAPAYVGGGFYCHNNRLTSLYNVHRHLPEVHGDVDFSNNPITSHVLGLLKIRGLTEVFLDDKKVQDIINKHLAGDRNLLACQEELIDAGLGAFAQL